ncbi:leucyl aminopeptidase [bacterium]|nr:leucyl aminopeptidase [bacterium]
MQIKFTEIIKDNYDYTILGVYENNKLSQTTSKFDKDLKGIITKSLKNSSFKGKAGEILIIHSEKIILTGLGNAGELTTPTLNKIGGIIGTTLKREKVSTALLMLDNFEDKKNFEIIYGAKLKTYKFDKYLTKDKENFNCTLFVHTENPTKSKEDFTEINSIIDGVITTRNLATEPSNILTTTEFTKQIKYLSKLGISIEIIDEKQLKKMGANLILAVGKGSAYPPYIVIMKYTGNKKSKKTIALVGKGLCFDSGGISIKPSAHMDEMKSDMTGAATVVGIMEMIAKQKAKINLTGIIGLAENMPDGASYKPGDILTSLSGQTVEVLNTDAEGRLVLADCITYANQKVKPTAIIDFATLTGAIMIALGEYKAGLFTNSDNLGTKLLTAGNESGDELWQFPLSKKYNEMLSSPVADMANISHPDRLAGSITAAEFLHNFAGDTPWAHIDIAGTAWTTSGNDISPKGLTGFGVRLINDFLKNFNE